ncbi:MAG: hypothetical protein H6738_04125 [Alphaproteobacteria bacterium]|nr:hypothetical protein [Alphaproteobacteria bacterium]MCB9695958.1 hypothetical protein [Alphaproteobacteria bacterium]
MIWMTMGAWAAAPRVLGVELASGVVTTGTPDLVFGHFRGRAVPLSGVFRWQEYPKQDRLPFVDWEAGLSFSVAGAADLEGDPVRGWDLEGPDQPYAHKRLFSRLTFGVGRIELGATWLQPLVGLGIEAVALRYDMDFSTIDASSEDHWQVTPAADTYGGLVGLRMESHGWTVDGRAALGFGPALAKDIGSGSSFGDLDGQVVGDVGNLDHAGRLSRFEARVGATHGISPFLSLSHETYRMTMDDPDGLRLASPFRNRTTSAMLGVALRNRRPE